MAPQEALFPEIVKVAALAGAQVLADPTDLAHPLADSERQCHDPILRCRIRENQKAPDRAPEDLGLDRGIRGQVARLVSGGARKHTPDIFI